MSAEFPYDKKKPTLKQLTAIMSKLENDIQGNKYNDNEKIVGKALVYMFKNRETLNIDSRNKVYLFIKEYTKLNTKAITYVIAKFRTEHNYFNFMISVDCCKS